MGTAIGIDVGGTKALALVVRDDGAVLDRAELPTPSTAPEILAVLGRLVGDLRERHAPTAIGLSLAGWVDRERKRMTFSPHLPWRDEPLAQQVEELVGLPCVLENDANAAAWGEFRFGAGAGATDLLLVTVGSGVGSGIVLDGRLVRGSGGMAGELGHTKLVPDGPPCPCGRRGCVDMYASGRGLERAYTARSGAAATGHEVGALRANGDGDATAAVDDVAGALGRGIAEAVMLLDPGLVVVGGGLVGLGPSYLAAVEDALRAALGANVEAGRVRLALAELGAEAGAVGAADLARDAAARG